MPDAAGDHQIPGDVPDDELRPDRVTHQFGLILRLGAQRRVRQLFPPAEVEAHSIEFFRTVDHRRILQPRHLNPTLNAGEALRHITAGDDGIVTGNEDPPLLID